MTALTLSLVLQTSLLVSAPGYAEAYQDAQETSRPLVVLVGADWCPACMTMKSTTLPSLERTGKLKSVAFTVVNSDRQPELARRLMRGGSIPQLIVFARTPDGWRRMQLIGAQSEGRVAELIDQAVRMQAPTQPVADVIGAE